jgi:hypothetical protein
MSPGAGSPADVPCPQCQSTLAVVALNIPTAIFYRCSECKHVWAVPGPQTSHTAAIHEGAGI